MSRQESEIQGDLIDETIMVEAEQWFVRLNSGNCDSKATAAFARWRLEDPQRARAWQSVEAVWGKSASVSEDPFILELRRSALAENTVAAGKNDARPMVHSRYSGLWKSLAAAVFLGIGVLLGAVYFTSSDPQTVRYATGFGEQRKLTLEDGSALTLDSASRIEVTLSDSERKVNLLSGRARFNVARIAERPFVVNAGDGFIRALGTAFDVYRENGTVTVTLLEGKVEVVASADEPSASAILAPGQQVIYSEHDGLLPTKTVDTEVAAGWADGRLVFKGIPLADALDQVNRYARRKIRLDDREIGKMRFRGEFNTGDVQSVAHAIELLYPVKVIDNGSGDILLVRRSED